MEGWTTELEQAKTYEEEQSKSKDVRIAELESWTTELEQAKTYSEEQSKAKDKRIAELEQAKAYGEEQSKAKDARIAELESWTAELEKAKSWLLSQIEGREAKINSLSKRLTQQNAQLTASEEEKEALRQALTAELEKPWYKKLVNHKSAFDFPASKSLETGSIMPQSLDIDNKQEKRFYYPETSKGFDHIVSLGYNCEVSFRIEDYTKKKLDSYPLSWAYVLDQSNMAYVLNHLDLISTTKAMMYVPESGMFNVEDLNINVHTSIDKSQVETHEWKEFSAFEKQAKNEIANRFNYLNHKWQRLLNSQESTLFLLKLQGCKGKEICRDIIITVNGWLLRNYKCGKYMLACFTDSNEIFNYLKQERTAETTSHVTITKIGPFAEDDNTHDGGDIAAWIEAIDKWFHFNSNIESYYRAESE